MSSDWWAKKMGNAPRAPLPPAPPPQRAPLPPLPQQQPQYPPPQPPPGQPVWDGYQWVLPTPPPQYPQQPQQPYPGQQFPQQPQTWPGQPGDPNRPPPVGVSDRAIGTGAQATIEWYGGEAWKSGTQCPNCGDPRFFEGITGMPNHASRCTACGYNSRFPIQRGV